METRSGRRAEMSNCGIPVRAASSDLSPDRRRELVDTTAVTEYDISRDDEMKSSPLDAAVTAAAALGHPARVRTLAMLRSGELCVCQITAVLELAPSTVSAHLKELRRAGLVTERKAGRWVHFGLAQEPAARAWIAAALAAAGDDAQLVADARLVAALRTLPVEDLCRSGFDRTALGKDRAAVAGP
jgi:DNA-binding transcriptional ArsR family regulator